MDLDAASLVIQDTLLSEELSISDRDFEFLRKMIHKTTGITIDESKRVLLQGRLATRIKELNIDNIKGYLTLLRYQPKSELEHLANVITTNTTSFLRHDYQFGFLANYLKQKSRIIRKYGINMWSAGCSTGQEPYSIAWVATKFLPPDAVTNISIFASDIDSTAIQKAISGIYSTNMLTGLPENFIQDGFLRGKGQYEGLVKIKPHVQALVKFQRLNLVANWSISTHYEIIFCRNVCIYFDKDTQRILFNRFAELQRPGDYLFTGRSEHMPDGCSSYKLVGKSTYQRI